MEPKYAPREGATKLDPYADTLTGWLKANEHRNKRERRTLCPLRVRYYRCTMSSLPWATAAATERVYELALRFRSFSR